LRDLCSVEFEGTGKELMTRYQKDSASVSSKADGKDGRRGVLTNELIPFPMTRTQTDETFTLQRILSSLVEFPNFLNPTPTPQLSPPT